jgi:hypothetical protein
VLAEMAITSTLVAVVMGLRQGRQAGAKPTTEARPAAAAADTAATVLPAQFGSGSDRRRSHRAFLNADMSAALRSEVSIHEVPSQSSHVLPVEVAGELVLVDGWRSAWVLNPSAVAIWERVDGHTSLNEIAVLLSIEYRAEAEVVLADVVATAQQFGQAGLLVGMPTSEDGLNVTLKPTPPVEAGTLVNSVVGRDLDGVDHSLSEFLESDVLLINWNPHCGYCAGVVPTLAALEASLMAAGVKIVLGASGDPATNRQLLSDTDWDPTVWLVDDSDGLFHGSGTPTAYHLDSTGALASSPAYGAGNIVGLAEQLAGIDRHAEAESPESVQVRYLLERDGVCAPGAGDTPGVAWTHTCVYRISDHHVGVRVDAETTAATLDRLFPGARVTDPRAGHSFSVALYTPEVPSHGRVGRGLNLLIQPGRTPTRSRDPARILRALLFELHDQLNGCDPHEGCIRVNAIAVRNQHGGIGLLPPNLYAFAPRLQALLAQHGMALADNRWPEIDLNTNEVVVPEPQIPHDPKVLGDLYAGGLGFSELPAVLPGRYPLIGWCSIHPGDHELVELSPAQGAAANLSFVFHTGDPAERLTELGELFMDVPAYGLWYYDDTQLVELIAAALNEERA